MWQLNETHHVVWCGKTDIEKYQQKKNGKNGKLELYNYNCNTDKIRKLEKWVNVK